MVRCSPTVESGDRGDELLPRPVGSVSLLGDPFNLRSETSLPLPTSPRDSVEDEVPKPDPRASCGGDRISEPMTGGKPGTGLKSGGGNGGLDNGELLLDKEGRGRSSELRNGEPMGC
jgi:hypothetical protein